MPSREMTGGPSIVNTDLSAYSDICLARMLAAGCYEGALSVLSLSTNVKSGTNRFTGSLFFHFIISLATGL